MHRKLGDKCALKLLLLLLGQLETDFGEGRAFFFSRDFAHVVRPEGKEDAGAERSEATGAGDLGLGLGSLNAVGPLNAGGHIRLSAGGLGKNHPEVSLVELL